jgi:hypothetical protein
MLKRTKGYTLLLLLVLTGLAGRLSTTTITSKERRLVIDELKESKAAVLKSVKGLSEKQLNYKSNKHTPSIKEYLQQIAFSEQNLWNITDAALKQPEKKLEKKLSDEKALFLLANTKTEQENFKRTKTKWGNTEQILDAFKTRRNELIKFVKTSTDDMRNHILQMPAGYIDSYQMILHIGAHTDDYIKKIEEIKTNPAFPR